MGRRSDHTREELRKLILDAANRIIHADGFDNLTARHLANEVGYTPGTIYNIFTSMDDLYLEINGVTLDRLYEVLSSTECSNPKKTPLQNMKKMASLYMDFCQQNRAHWLMLFSPKLPEGRERQEWYQKKIDRLFLPLEQLMAPLFSTRENDRRRMAARLLWSSIHGLCFLQQTGKIPIVSGRSRPLEMAEYLIETFVRGIEKT